MSFERIGIRPARILLPNPSVIPETWACIACDQYTSEPDYWNNAYQTIGDAPSALHLILPECSLNESAERVPKIHATMTDYLQKGILSCGTENGFVLCERTTPSGTRGGLVCTVDLEQYSFEKNDLPLIRPTEQTIAARLPARLAIRRGAPIELTHILILIDDPERTVLEPLRKRKNELKKLYDFDLMLNGGHLTGWAVENSTDLAHIDHALNALLDLKTAQVKDGKPMLLAVGDGNHSLATAKAYWNEIRETLSADEKENHPARFALCEIENIHDDALLFEPIHRLLKDVRADDLTADWREYARSRGMTLSKTGDGHAFTLVSGTEEERIMVNQPEGAIPCETIQKYLDDFILRHPDTEIDYIHGTQSLKNLAAESGNVGFLLPDIDKNSFFSDVERLGVLPRKTFSMGEADEKRFYMEAKEI